MALSVVSMPAPFLFFLASPRPFACANRERERGKEMEREGGRQKEKGWGGERERVKESEGERERVRERGRERERAFARPQGSKGVVRASPNA